MRKIMKYNENDIIRYDKIMKDEDIIHYNKIMKDKIGLMTFLDESEIVTKFNGIKLVSEGANAKYEMNKFVKIDLELIGIISLLFAVVFLITNNGSILKLCIAIILAVLGGVLFFIQKDDEKIEQVKQNPKLYMADCYVYEIVKRVLRSYKYGLHKKVWYYAKITDMVRGYSTEEIRLLGVKECPNNEMIKAKLYVIEDKGQYYMYIEKE